MAYTNQPGVGLDASGNLLPGYKYMTYSNGVGQGTPMYIGDVGIGGQMVTSNAPPAAGTYNPNITAGPQQQASPSWANAFQPTAAPSQASNINQPGAAWNRWAPPATTAGNRQGSFAIANSLWDSNSQNYRNRLAQMLRK